MKKKLIIAALVACLIIGCAVFAFNKEDSSENVKNLLDDLDSYQLVADMEITNKEEVDAYEVSVDYAKVDKEEYFKVSITDKAMNQTQDILRNSDGVYVITPTLNQIFKFEGDWPLNSLKPYLIQSMVQIANQEDVTISTKNDEVHIVSEVNYPNNSAYNVQEMFFDNDGKIKEIKICNTDDVVQLSLKFKTVKYNNDIDDAVFEVPSNLKSQVSTNSVSELDLPLYPMQIYDSALDSSNSVDVNGATKHILTYSGDRNFSIVQKILETPEETQTVIMSGSFVDTITDFGFYDGEHLTIVKDNIEYTIYSDDLTMEEMIDVLTSIQVVVMK